RCAALCLEKQCCDASSVLGRPGLSVKYRLRLAPIFGSARFLVRPTPARQHWQPAPTRHRVKRSKIKQADRRPKVRPTATISCACTTEPPPNLASPPDRPLAD